MRHSDYLDIYLGVLRARVRVLLADVSLSQAAREAGVGRNTLHDWLHGRDTIQLHTLRQIARWVDSRAESRARWHPRVSSTDTRSA